MLKSADYAWQQRTKAGNSRKSERRMQPAASCAGHPESTAHGTYRLASPGNRLLCRPPYSFARGRFVIRPRPGAAGQVPACGNHIRRRAREDNNTRRPGRIVFGQNGAESLVHCLGLIFRDQSAANARLIAHDHEKKTVFLQCPKYIQGARNKLHLMRRGKIAMIENQRAVAIEEYGAVLELVGRNFVGWQSRFTNATAGFRAADDRLGGPSGAPFRTCSIFEEPRDAPAAARGPAPPITRPNVGKLSDISRRVTAVTCVSGINVQTLKSYAGPRAVDAFRLAPGFCAGLGVGRGAACGASSRRAWRCCTRTRQ